MANYTPNYGLHQWEPGDDFLRTDFNEDFAKLDAAIKQVADTKADKKSTEAAVLALQTAVSQRVEVVTGSYTGNGGTLNISLGFQPKAVIIPSGYTPMIGLGDCNHLVVVTTWGFQVVHNQVSGTTANVSGRLYHYIALK